MKFEGKISKSGKFYHVEIPALSIDTQGKTKNECLAMAVDAIESLVHVKGFKVSAEYVTEKIFTVEANDTNLLMALLIKRTRMEAGLSIRDLQVRLGYKSPQSIQRIESGRVPLTFDTLSDLMDKISGEDFYIKKRVKSRAS